MSTLYTKFYHSALALLLISCSLTSSGLTPPNSTLPNNEPASNPPNVLVLAAEICNNAIDDDGDGMIDCADSDCQPLITYAIANCQSSTASIDLTVNGADMPFGYRWSDILAQAKWSFNNNTNDDTGNNFHATQLSGTATYDASDRVEGSNCFVFNGATFIRFGVDGGFLETAFSATSRSFWIKPTSLTGTQVLFEQGSSTNGLAARLNGNLLSAAYRVANTQFTTGNLTFPADGAWHHVAVVFNNGTLTIYLDGVASTPATSANATIPADGNNDAVGARNGSDAFGHVSNFFYTGKMDEMRYYTSALSLQTIQDLGRHDGDRLNLTAGTYAVTVSNAVGCSATKSINLAVPCVEICNNGADDDGDGQIDNADADCAFVTKKLFLSGENRCELVPTKDSYLQSARSYENQGGSSSIIISSISNGVIQFDLSAIPAGATIASATLTLMRNGGTIDPSGNTVEVMALTQSWVEGNQSTTAQACVSGVNWDSQDCSTGLNWTTPGGTTNGTVYGSAPITTGTNNVIITSLVQAWYNGTLTNNGLLLKLAAGNTKVHGFSSRTGSTPPSLTILFTAPNILDRVDPVATADATTAETEKLAAGSGTTSVTFTQAPSLCGPLQLSVSAPITVSTYITPISTTTTTLTKSIVAGNDDVEEEGLDGGAPGSMYFTSSDLEITKDGSKGHQTIGLRFTGLDIPADAIITNAFLTFGAVSADSPNDNTSATNLTIKAHAADNPPVFPTTTSYISNSPTTVSAVSWSPGAWTSGTAYHSPNLSSIVQEIANRPGWSSGNSMAFFISGTGSRSAASFEGNASNAPKLTVEYSLPGGSFPANPNVTASLKHGATTIANLTNPTYNSGTGLLTWTSSLNSPVTIPANAAISLTVTTAETTPFIIQYDSQTKPSSVGFPISSSASITSYAVYSAPFPGGSIITESVPGTTVYPRAVVTSPFGPSDISSVSITITPSGSTVNAGLVASSGCTSTYEYAWVTPGTGGTYSIPATVREGAENTATAVQNLSFNICNSCPPDAVDDVAIANGNSAITINVLANDTDPNNNINPATLTVITQPACGTVTKSGNQLVFTPNANFNGTDQFTYQVCDLTSPSPLCDIATVRIISTVVKQLYLSDPSQVLDRIDPVATADATTAISTILSATSGTGVVTVDATSSGTLASGSVLTIPHTTGAGSNRLMIVSIARGNGGVSSVTYAGQNLTNLGQLTLSDVNLIGFYLVNPPSGTANLVVNFSPSATIGANVGVTTFFDVDQSNPISGMNGTTGASAVASFMYSSTPGHLVYCSQSSKGTSVTPGSGLTELWDRQSGVINGAAGIKNGASSVPLQWISTVNNDWAIAAVSIKPADVTGSTSTTFTQSPALCSPLTIKAGQPISVTNFVSIVTGTMPANPNISALLKYGDNNIINLTNPSYNSSTGMLTWTGTLAADVTVPAGQAISLVVTSIQSGVSFRIEFDSQTKPSKINLPVSTFIDVISNAFYDAPFPGGNVITNAVGGTNVYNRSVVTDPFGFNDITNLNLKITPPGTTVTSNIVATAGCTKTYEYLYTTPFTGGTYNVIATAKEGFENTVTDAMPTNIDVCSPSVTTPVFALGATSSRCIGAGSTTYSATASSHTGITYSLDAASLNAGNTISSVTGVVNFTAAWNGTTVIMATATGCGGPKSATHTVTTRASVGTPVFALGANSTRCQGSNTATYSATATNSTGITYSLDGASLAAGNSINSNTGAVTFVPSWTSNTTITASAAGCSGPKTATHVITTTPAVTAPVFALGATSTRCQGAEILTYTATASNTTGITYSLDAASLAAGNTINATTGAVTYVSNWSGTTIITASAAGCLGPNTSTHTVTVTPNGTITFALGSTSSRAFGAGTVTYSATANNSGSITYSLDATSLAAGLTINSSTGMVTYNSSWVGNAIITASVTGCAGTQTATHTAQTSNVFKQLYLSDPNQSLDRVDPVATADATSASTLPLSTGSTGVAVDATSTGFWSNPNSTSFTVSHTTGAGLNRLMLVGISQKNRLVTSVTYGGTPLTLVGESISSGNARMHIFSLINPPSGTANVVVNLNSNPDKGIVVGVTTFTGVDQDTPLGIFNSAYNKSTSASVTVTSASDELVFDVVTVRGGTGSPASGQTQLWKLGTTQEIELGGGCTKPGASSVTMTWNIADNDWAIGAVSIKPAPAVTNVTFTQNPAVCTPLTIKAGQTITVTNYVSILSGTMPASPNITALLQYGSTNIINLTSPTYNSGAGLLTWTGTLTSDVTVPAGQAISLRITSAQAGVTFRIEYDSQTKPSKINLPVTTFIAIPTYAVYDAPYPGGNVITSTSTGAIVYPRAIVTDPFGFDDITALNITITPPGTTVAGTSVATAGCTRTYQYTWNTAALGGTYSLPATAKEGYENTVAVLKSLNFDICSPAIGTPVFALGASTTRCQGAATTTYAATSANSTGISYSLDALSIAAGNTINTATGEVTFIANWTNPTVITASATGCGGPKTATHTVTVTSTVGVPVFALGAASTRCQGGNSVTYAASATNTSGITYSLDAASISGGNTINASTGAVAFAAGWNGTTTVTASAAGCNGPKIATHTVTIIPSVGTPVFALGASSGRCGALVQTYTATATNSTNISYSLDAASLAAGNTINNATGSASFLSSWIGTSTITATATGCVGPTTATHTVTISSACPPVALDDAANGTGGSPLTINVLANDSDINNNIDPNSLSILTQPSNGSAVISNNTFVYLPNGTFQGVDQFTYQICDLTSPTPLCASATVVVTIDPTTVDVCAEAVSSQVYYIPYPEQDARLALIASTGSTWLPIPSNNIRTIISIKLPYPNMTLVWDHWEDGYEVNPNNPTQGTTQVWGDGNPYNGIPPGYAEDILPAGAAIVLDNTMPASPRVPSNIFYDGKDKILSSGAITVTQVCGEPSIIGVQCMKTNVTNSSTFGKSFTIPVGQNFNSKDFAYTALFIRASQDNTVINIDKDNNGNFETTATLSEGQSYFVNGGVLNGATVTGSAPIGVDLHFGGLDGYSSREVPIFPATWYSNTYYSPVPTTLSPDTAAVFLYNSLNRDININWSFGTTSSGTIALPAKTVKRFPLNLSSTSCYKFVNPTGESFTAIEIVDSYTPGGGGNSGSTYDWAFNLISESRLTSFAAIAWAPGSTNGTANGNPVWVTPAANTTLYVKYDGEVLNGGSASPCGLRYDESFTVNALSYKKLLDASDKDQSGLAVYTCDGTKIAAVYGEDPSLSGPANPYWDVGSTIQPFCGQKLILANDDRAYTLTGDAVTIPVLKNDAGFLAVINPASLSTVGYLQPKNGTVSVNPNGTILYTPNGTFVGRDTFEYGVCSTLGNPPNIVCDRAKVIVEINSCPTPSRQNLITGQVYLDKNKDGQNNDGDTGFSPAKVYLFTDANCNTVPDANELTDSVIVDNSGYYQFLVYPEKTIADNFDGPGNSNTCATGSDGTAGWASNWTDAGDVSVGFCVFPPQPEANVDVEIKADGSFGNALRLDDLNKSATRMVNIAGSTYAFLSFSYRRATNALAVGEDIYVQVSTNGTAFTTIFTISGNGQADAAYVNVFNQDISAYASGTTYIRFLTNANVDEGDFVFFDNILIKYLLYPQCYITRIDMATLPAFSYVTTAGQYAFTAANAGTCLGPYDFGVARSSLAISGTVFNDLNGLSDGAVNGTAFGNPAGATLYAYLVSITGEVLHKATVNTSTGNYTFPNADVNTTYNLLVTTQDVALYTQAPTSSTLPAGWVSAGETYGNNNNAGLGNEPGVPNSAITVTTAASPVTGVNIGIQRVDGGPDKFACVSGAATMAAVTTPGTWSALVGNPGTATITQPNSPTSTITNFSAPGTYYFLWTNNLVSDLVVVTVAPDLVISAQPTGFIQCIGGNQAVSVSGTGGIAMLTYQWQSSADNVTFTNIPGATSTSYVPPSTTAGTTYYRVIITPNSNGCGTVISASVPGVVVGGPAITAQPANITQCPNGTQPLSVTASGGAPPLIYQWQSSPDSLTFTNISGATASTYIPPAAVPGKTFYRVLISSDGSGCGAATASVVASVTVSTPPTVDLGPDVTGCAGQTVTLTPVGSGGLSPYTFNWSNGLGSGASKTISLSSTTTFTVTVTDSRGCTSTDAILVTIDSCPEICNNGLDDDGDGLTDCEDPDCGAPSITNATATDPTNCPILNNGQITITATGSDLEYSIDGGASFQASNVFTGLSAGSFTITVRNTVTGCVLNYNGNPLVVADPVCTEICDNGVDDDGDGLADCADSECGPVAYAGSDVNFCTGTSTTISATATSGTGPFTYAWSHGLGTGQSKTVSPAITTTYVVTITAAYGCTATDAVQVTPIICPEICADGVDNDFDGLIDCADPDCQAVGQPQLADDVYQTCPGTVFMEQPIFNDNNLQNPVYSIYSNAAKGNVTINYQGVFTYTPNNNPTCGTDNFQYQVCNLSSGCCDKATVTLNIGDTVPPVLQNMPADITISCGDPIPVAPNVFGVDDCPGIYVNFNEVNNQGNPGACQDYTIVRTWTATDLCYNSTSSSQTISVKDLSPPEIFRMYTLSNNKRLVAGVFKETKTSWSNVKFPIPFAAAPLVFATVTTANGSEPVIVRIKDVTTEGFNLRIQEEELGDNVHAIERVSWMAIEPGVTTDASLLEATSIASVSNTPYALNYVSAYTTPPVLITCAQTTNEADPFTVRYNTQTSNSAQLFLDEEQSKDAEKVHASEKLAALSLVAGNLTDKDNSFVAEAGQTSLTHTWTTVSLSRKFTKPVALFGGQPIGNDPATIRVRNVTANSFEVRIEEWNYLDKIVPARTVSYIVVEGSVPANVQNPCISNVIPLTPGVNIFANDNCDNQVSLSYTQSSNMSPQGLLLTNSWVAADDCGNTFTDIRVDTCKLAAVKLKARLSGAMIGNGTGVTLMRDNLRVKNFLPGTSPYIVQAGPNQNPAPSTETVSASMLAVTGDDAIVDWVLVQLRDAALPAKVIASRSALIQRDGDVVMPDGSDLITFPGIGEGNYFAVLSHRNHLGLMTNSIRYLSLINTPMIDFKLTQESVYGTNAGQMGGGARMLWSGDLNGDKRTIYQGPSNDVFKLFSEVLVDPANEQALANFIRPGYNNADLNMDGNTVYQGPGNDRSLLLLHTILSHPNNSSLLANFIALAGLP